MDYKTKIKLAEEIAHQLQLQKDTESIKSELLAKGLYKGDIDKIIFSAKKIVGEKYQPKIIEFLLEGKQLHGAEEFKLIDKEILESLISKETKNLGVKEKNKITKLIKEGQPAEKVFEQNDTRFFPPEKAAEHIAKLQEVKQQNSGGGRMLNIFGGIGLIILTAILFFAANRIFYVLPFIGLAMIFKGLTTQEIE